MPRTVLALGDMHCGHLGGLTPPAWMVKSKRNRKIHDLQKESWRHYLERVVKPFKKYDVVIGMGDYIDGKGARSGGNELITTDLEEQAEMAFECLRMFEAGTFALVHGTPYHSNSASGEEMDRVVADRLREDGRLVHMDHRLFPEVEGVVFDVRHKIGGSSVPYGVHTPIAKEAYHNLMAAEWGSGPRAGVVLRGHVHKFHFCGGPGWLGVNTPALQTVSKYGSRECSGIVHWGAVPFTCADGRVVNNVFNDAVIEKIGQSFDRVVKC